MLALNAYRASGRFRDRLSGEKLTVVQKAYEGRFLPISMICSGLYCTYGAIRTLIGGVDTWWLWFLAAAAYFGTVPMMRFAGAKLGAVEVRPDVETQRRRRRVLWFAAPAAVCLFAARPAAEAAARLDNGFVLVGSIVLMVAALAGFTAAGWAAVWASEASSSPPSPNV
jgi:hypothetical protein